MEEQLISFETAMLAKEKGFNIEGTTVFDLKHNNKIVSFKDIAFKTFIDDVETGYRDKALYYLKEDWNRTDDNTDEGYYLLAPTQSLLQKWLRDKKGILIWCVVHPLSSSHAWCYDLVGYREGVCIADMYHYGNGTHLSYEEALEQALFEGLKLL